jgi:hypothetical protein
MNVIDAAHAVVHDYPGGTVALAPRIGMAPAVLRGKVNCNDERHHLTLAESLRIQSLTGDHRIFMAEADELGYMVTPIPHAEGTDIACEAMRSIAEFGDFIGDVELSLRDDRISLNEMRELDRKLLEAQSHIACLHRLLRTASER